MIIILCFHVFSISYVGLLPFRSWHPMLMICSFWSRRMMCGQSAGISLHCLWLSPHLKQLYAAVLWQQVADTLTTAPPFVLNILPGITFSTVIEEIRGPSIRSISEQRFLERSYYISFVYMIGAFPVFLLAFSCGSIWHHLLFKSLFTSFGPIYWVCSAMPARPATLLYCELNTLLVRISQVSWAVVHGLVFWPWQRVIFRVSYLLVFLVTCWSLSLRLNSWILLLL